MTTNPAPVNLFDLDRAGFKTFFEAQGLPGFRGVQVMKWLHQRQCTNFQAMSNLSQTLRHQLEAETSLALPTLLHQHRSPDGTIKWLVALSTGNCVETVFIPEKQRGTLCISSQVGCALDCSFCATGKQGFNRNLSVSEIIGQVWLAKQALKQCDPHPDYPSLDVTNVVMMGMGEPLLNEAAVIKAMDLMMDDDAYGLSKYRVTLSTSGIVPAMERLREASACALAVSLHAPTNDLRDILVPINRKYPLEQLMAVCRSYFEREPRRCVTFEYVMLHDINDRPQDAQALTRLLAGMPCKLNLIPFNPFKGCDYRTSEPDRILRFQQRLQKAGYHTTIRKTRGLEVDAACGQLAGGVTDRSKRTEQGRSYQSRRAQDHE